MPRCCFTEDVIAIVSDILTPTPKQCNSLPSGVLAIQYRLTILQILIQTWRYCAMVVTLSFHGIIIKETKRNILVTIIKYGQGFHSEKHSDCPSTTWARWWHHCCETQLGVQHQLRTTIIIYLFLFFNYLCQVPPLMPDIIVYNCERYYIKKVSSEWSNVDRNSHAVVFSELVSSVKCDQVVLKPFSYFQDFRFDITL